MKNCKYIAMMLLLSTASQSYALVNKVAFSGEITADTCSVSIGGAASDKGAVDLPKISASSLANLGATAADTKFAIEIISANGAKCDVENTIDGIYFEPSSYYVNADGRLSNIIKSGESGGAKDVELRLLNNNKQPIDISESYGDQVSSAIDGKKFNYYVQYYATSENVKPGKVLSQANYTIVYK